MSTSCIKACGTGGFEPANNIHQMVSEQTVVARMRLIFFV